MSSTPAVRSPYWAGSVPVSSDMLPMKLVSITGPRAERPSGRTTPLIRIWTLAYSFLTWKFGLEAAESYDTPGSCRMTLSIGALSACGRYWMLSRVIVVVEAPTFGKRLLSRAWSSAVILASSAACAGVGPLLASAGALVGACGARGLAMRLGFGFFGAVTTISGMLVRGVGLFVA